VAPPSVSALIGCWNNAETLGRAIDSILSQTLTDIELIVVDDGSTDRTPELVEGYDDPRVRRLALEHMGIARSLNRGLEEARAEAVAFLDADDWALPARLERQLAALRASPDAAVVGCWMDEVDETGAPLTPRQPRDAGSIREVLARHNSIPGTSSMVRRRAALDAGGFDPGFLYAADYELWTRLALDHDLICLPEVLAIRQMSAGAAGSRHERDQIRETLRIRWNAMRRNRAPGAAVHMARPLASLLAPPRVKAAVRTRRGMAP
jgi:glycosyltransferase involved in cell wall biosynthesis